MSRIPSTFIDDLLNRTDIVEVIDDRVKLKKAGKNYSACCPFHNEKTPSFSVSPDKQFYYCFGCGASGNAIGFLMEYERASFVEAVEALARQAGVEVPREEADRDFRKKKESRSKQLYFILDNANTYFQKQLKEHPKKNTAITYLKNRGLTGKIASEFTVGFAPPGFNNILTALGQNEENQNHLVDTGLVIRKEETGKLYDRFRDRIIFPIRDIRGRTIGFGGRVLGDEKPKYLNSPETEVFHKSKELYGLYEAKKANHKLERLMVVEGYMDVVSLAQFGITNAVATMGTACGEDHLRLAFRFVSEIIFCFDGDNAGRAAAKRALANVLPAMEDGRQIRFLFLPEGQDPDSLVRQIGPERFQHQLDNATPLEEFLFESAAEDTDISSMEGRARMSKIAAPMIERLPEGVFKKLVFNELAKRTGLDHETLKELQKSQLPEAYITPATKTSTTQPTKKSPTHNNSQPHLSTTSVHEARAPYNAPEQSVPHYLLEEFEPSNSPAPYKARTAIVLTPAKIATILLLESPKLLENIADMPAMETCDDEDTKRLNQVITYLKKRPESNFNTILGYWGGSQGLDEQKKLASLLANQLMSDAKIISTYNPLLELEKALSKISAAQQRAAISEELAKLKAKGLSNLSVEEKNRFRELTTPIKSKGLH